MSNQNGPLKGFRPLKDSKTPSENPPHTPLKSFNPAPYQPPQEFSSSPNINPPQQKIICTKCGASNSMSSSFCNHCGASVSYTHLTLPTIYSV